MAAATNLLGALLGTAVAKTISSGLVDANLVSMTSDITICALLGAIVWDLLTWWFGLPSSSSHALIGGLCGAALAASGNNWRVIIWAQPSSLHWWLGKGLLWKVIVPMVTSPIAGFVLGVRLHGRALCRLAEPAARRASTDFSASPRCSAPAPWV